MEDTGVRLKNECDGDGQRHAGYISERLHGLNGEHYSQERERERARERERERGRGRARERDGTRQITSTHCLLLLSLFTWS